MIISNCYLCTLYNNPNNKLSTILNLFKLREIFLPIWYTSKDKGIVAQIRTFCAETKNFNGKDAEQ